MGSVPGSGRSPGEENGSPLQYSCLGNPMDRGSWVGYSHGSLKRVRHDLVTKQKQHQRIVKLQDRSKYFIPTAVKYLPGRDSMLQSIFKKPSIAKFWVLVSLTKKQKAKKKTHNYLKRVFYTFFF